MDVGKEWKQSTLMESGINPIYGFNVVMKMVYKVHVQENVLKRYQRNQVKHL